MESASTAADQNGEESSGSDCISLLSVGIPAAETDRFGFIIGSGPAVGTEGPPPEVVRQRETKWLNIISQWDRILQKKTNKVKDQCRKGIPASLRARCWPLLCRATERMSQNKKLYETLDSSPALQSWVDVIERDIDRQFPFHEMFLSRDGHGQQGLFRVLKAYTQFRPDEGYCQGQGPVAAVLLMNMPAEEAFWCLVQISEQYLPGYYSPLLEGVLFDAGVLSGVLRKACPAIHRHLFKHGVEPLMFATDWLMCLYTRHLPFNALLRVWDLFFCYGVRVLFQVAVVLVRRALGRQEQRDECDGQMETLERLRGVKAQVLQEDDSFIEEVCSVPLSGRDLQRETEKQLERWRKERPSSTFDPRSRCHGYKAAWVQGREREERQERVERERGNLSFPVVRSPSSLSPSLLRKRWKRGSKAETGERDLDRRGEKEGEQQRGQEKLTGRESSGDGGKEGDGMVPMAEDSNKGNEREGCRKDEKEKQNVPAGCTELAGNHKASLEQQHKGATESQAQTGDKPTTQTVCPTDSPVPDTCIQTSVEQKEDGVCGLTHEDRGKTKLTQNTVVPPSPAVPATDSETKLELCEIEGSRTVTRQQVDSPEDEGHNATATPSTGPQDWGEAMRSQGTELIHDSAKGADSPEIAQEHVREDSRIHTTSDQLKQLPELQEAQGADKPDLSSQEGEEQLDHMPNTQQDICPQGNQNTAGGSVEILTSVVDKGYEEETDTATGASSDPSQSQTTSMSTFGPHQGETMDVQLSQTPETDRKSADSDPLLSHEELSEPPAHPGPVEDQIEGSPGVDQGEESSAIDQIVELPVLDQGEVSPTIPILVQEEERLSLDQSEESQATSVLHEVEESPILEKEEEFPPTAVLDQGEESPVIDKDKETPETPALDKNEDSAALDQVEGSPVLDRDDEQLETPVLHQGEGLHTLDQVEGGEELPVFHAVEGPPVLDQDEDTPATPVLDKGEGLTGLDVVEGAPVLDQVEGSESQESTQQSMVPEPELPTEFLSGAGNSHATSAQGSIQGLSRETLVAAPEGVPETVDGDKNSEGNACQEASPMKSDPGPPGGSLVTQDEGGSYQMPVSVGPHPRKTETVVPDDCEDVSPIAAGRWGGAGEQRLRKTPSSKACRPRRLSEDIFKDPNQERPKTMPPCEAPASPTSTHLPNSTSQDEIKPHPLPDPTLQDENKTHSLNEQTDHPRRFGLFRMLRGDRPKDRGGGEGRGSGKGKKGAAPKMTVPTILVQDFSDGVGVAEVGPGGGAGAGDGLSSKERRRRRREQERKEKEEEKARKKREKEKEKEKERTRERKKPQTRGKSFQVHSSSKGSTPNVPAPGSNSSKTPSSKRNSAPYFDTYF
ncbi:hypothetical protein JZ751_008725 [Albula glossodonta]|uniref:Rab-GAP TBC domain-containing protein n=1 Tax=Albula glossodonta TaxID=121402 RepID=A0A8T2P2M9_9TELE|nr:hypothetical protein JZ751_008725 [Albula glossodonta]